MNIKNLLTNTVSLDYPMNGMSQRKDYPRGTDEFRALMDILQNHTKHDPHVVIATIDVLLDVHYKGRFKNEVNDALYSIKWSGAYNTYITHPDAELSANPGFYADCLMYYGLAWARERREAGQIKKAVTL